jgi:putative ABC transport system substrate-binding protein
MTGRKIAQTIRRREDGVKRRNFIGVIIGAALAGPAADAQQPGKVWRIGSVIVTTPERGAYLAQALEQGLTDLGYVLGRDIVLSHRFAGPQPDQVRDVIMSLLPQIDLLVVRGTVGGTVAKKVAGTVPTVFVSVGAPVEIGLVQSLAHPGGNMTGMTFEAAMETYGKRLQILKEIVPDLKGVAVLRAVGDPNVGFAMISLTARLLSSGSPLSRLTLARLTTSKLRLLKSKIARWRDSWRLLESSPLLLVQRLPVAHSQPISHCALPSGRRLLPED